MHRQAKISAGHDAVVVLQDDIVRVAAVAVGAHVALDVVVRHAQLELQRRCHVVDTRIGRALGIDLAVEDLAGADLGHHVARAAVNRHVVARAQLVRRRTHDLQIRLLSSQPYNFKIGSTYRIYCSPN